MKRILVTGGAGFIGSHLVEALVKAGRRVRVLDDFSSGRREFLRAVRDDVEIVRGDVSRFADCAKAAKGVNVVFHLAAIRSVMKSVLNPLRSHNADATGTLCALEAARQAGVRRFVYASSSSAYGLAKSFPMREGDPARPLSPYGAAKLAGENYASAYFTTYGMETASMRFFNVFGPRQCAEAKLSQAVPGMIERLSQGKRPFIYGDGRQLRDFTYVSDVVAALLAASRAAKAPGETFNVASGDDHSILELYRHLSEILGRKDLEPIFQKGRPSDPRRTFADISKARRLLGWKPKVGFREGLERTAAAFGESE